MKHTRVFSACLTVAALAAGMGTVGIVTAPSAHAATSWGAVAWNSTVPWKWYQNYDTKPSLIFRIQGDLGEDAGYQLFRSGECGALISYDGINGAKRSEHAAGVGDDVDEATSAAIRKAWGQPYTLLVSLCQG